MARLNEPAASHESFESLKRRFIRQNRDIARANSTQSLRIRDLENDNSTLLSENLNLREKILRLQSDKEARQIQRIGEQTLRLKAQLESKLLEISALVCDLGQEIPEPNARPKHGENTSVSTTLSPIERWRNICQENEAIMSPDGRLPPIMEDISYHRRTSGNQDIFSHLGTAELFSMESPEIGSPPKSQFVDTDPVKIDLPIRLSVTEVEEPIHPDSILSVTVEERKRRKDSLGPEDVRRFNHTTLLPEKQDNTGSFRKAAKRKISARDEGEKVAKEEVEKDEAGITKAKRESPSVFKVTQTADEVNMKMNEKEVIKRKKCEDLSNSARESKDKLHYSERKALAPKSVNASPRKRSPSITGDIKKPISNMTQKMALSKGRTRGKVSQIESVCEATGPILETTEIIMEPDSRFNLTAMIDSNKYQPPSTPSSNPQPSKSDESPLPSSNVNSQKTDGSRPSRRSRGSVSYAEPNLRHKMRRPTKELADAVIRDRSDQLSRQDEKSEEDGEAQLTTTMICSFNEKMKKISDCGSNQRAEDYHSCKAKTHTPLQQSSPLEEQKKKNSSLNIQVSEVSFNSSKTLQTKTKTATISHRKKCDLESSKPTNDAGSKTETNEDCNSDVSLPTTLQMRDLKSSNFESTTMTEHNLDLTPTLAKSEGLSRRSRQSTSVLRGLTPVSDNYGKSDVQKSNESKSSKTLSSDYNPGNRVGVSTRQSLMIK